MASVEEHYKNLLARHYSWMCGGHETKVPECLRFFEAHAIVPRGCRKALDLGCGSGFQSLALAQLGFEVLSLDTSAELLDELRAHSQNQRITVVQGDMRAAELYTARSPFEIVVCM